MIKLNYVVDFHAGIGAYFLKLSYGTTIFINIFLKFSRDLLLLKSNDCKTLHNIASFYSMVKKEGEKKLQRKYF